PAPVANRPVTTSSSLATAIQSFPPTVEPVLTLGVARLVEYQGDAYARLFLDRLRPLLAGLTMGVVVGTGILYAMSGKPPAEFNQIMNGVVGGICLVVVLMQAYRLTGREIPTLPPHPASAVGVGLLAGAVSTINHGAGPIVTVYLLQEKLEKRLMVGTLLFYFLIGNAIKVPTYLLLPFPPDGKPLINWETLHNSIWFIPLIPVGTVLGAWMHHKVPEKPFAAIMYIAAAASAAQLLFKANAAAAAVIGTVSLLAFAVAWMTRPPVKAAVVAVPEPAKP
ncbi:MAG: TSUP family transporter, partial [Planctomycetota bacterium]|nr:TSUP family transporter [Planctomycetota bacterium]